MSALLSKPFRFFFHTQAGTSQRETRARPGPSLNSGKRNASATREYSSMPCVRVLLREEEAAALAEEEAARRARMREEERDARDRRRRAAQKRKMSEEYYVLKSTRATETTDIRSF